MEVERQIPAIVLAAGLSTRMGAFKPLLRLGGRLLIQHVIEALESSGAVGPIIVVTGHQRDAIERAVTGLAVRTVFNPHFAKGEMLSSLKAGIGELPEEAGIELNGKKGVKGFVLAFADQPAVQALTIEMLVRRFGLTGAPIVLPEYLGKRGHPVVISTALVPAIQALPAEGTLRTVVHEHLTRAELVQVNDASVLDDLDTPEDFVKAEERWTHAESVAAGAATPLAAGLR